MAVKKFDWQLTYGDVDKARQQFHNSSGKDKKAAKQYLEEIKTLVELDDKEGKLTKIKKLMNNDKRLSASAEARDLLGMNIFKDGKFEQYQIYITKRLYEMGFEINMDKTLGGLKQDHNTGRNIAPEPEKTKGGRLMPDPGEPETVIDEPKIVDEQDSTVISKVTNSKSTIRPTVEPQKPNAPIAEILETAIRTRPIFVVTKEIDGSNEQLSIAEGRLAELFYDYFDQLNDDVFNQIDELAKRNWPMYTNSINMCIPEIKAAFDSFTNWLEQQNEEQNEQSAEQPKKKQDIDPVTIVPKASSKITDRWKELKSDGRYPFALANEIKTSLEQIQKTIGKEGSSVTPDKFNALVKMLSQEYGMKINLANGDKGMDIKVLPQEAANWPEIMIKKRTIDDVNAYKMEQNYDANMEAITANIDFRERPKIEEKRETELVHAHTIKERTERELVKRKLAELEPVDRVISVQNNTRVYIKKMIAEGKIEQAHRLMAQLDAYIKREVHNIPPEVRKAWLERGIIARGSEALVQMDTELAHDAEKEIG